MTRRLVAEGAGSLLLAAGVIGSGNMAERLSSGNAAVALIANTGATVAILAALIALLGPVSGAHFNPAVSLVQAIRGALSWREAAGYAARAGRRVLRGRRARPCHVRTAADPALGAFAYRACTMVSGVRCYVWAVARRDRTPPRRGCPVDGGRLDWCSLLVYVLDLVC